MVLIGKVKEYNGKFGIIDCDNMEVDFDFEDISFGEEIKIGDNVEFRLETRFQDIFVAKNITKVSEEYNECEE